MSMNEGDRLLVMQVMGMDKSAENFLGTPTATAPTAAPKTGAITKTGPMQGDEARTSLMNYTRSKVTEAADNEQDAKDKSKQEATKPGVVTLESASDTPPKKAPEKKPEEESENAGEKKAFFPGAIGATYGALRKKDPGEDRSQSIGRSFLRDILAQAGGIAGAGVGAGVGMAAKSPLVAILGTLLGGGAGLYGGYRGAKALSKRPLEKLEDAEAAEKEEKPAKGEKTASLVKAALMIPPPATTIGALIGLARKKDYGEDRGQAVGRSALTGLGTDVGMLAGGGLGMYGGKKLGNKLLGGEASTFEWATDKKKHNRRRLLEMLGTVLGAGVGGYAGYSLSKRSPKRLMKDAAAYGERKGMSTTSKILLGALAGAGIPVAMWHGGGSGVRKMIKKVYELGILKRMHALPQTNPKLAKGLMYAPAAIGGIAGGMSGGGGDNEFKLAGSTCPIVKRAAPDMRQMAADEMAGNSDEEASAAAREDIIPYLGPLGGKVLGGLGDLTGGLGLSGVSDKLKGWSENPAARSIAGGGTTALAAILTALAAKKLLGRGDEEE